MKKIGIIGAMELEVETLKSKMNVVKTTKKQIWNFLKGTLNGSRGCDSCSSGIWKSKRRYHHTDPCRFI